MDFFAYTVRTQNAVMSLGTCSYAQIIHRWKAKVIFRNICVRTHNTSMSLGTCSYMRKYSQARVSLDIKCNPCALRQREVCTWLWTSCATHVHYTLRPKCTRHSDQLVPENSLCTMKINTCIAHNTSYMYQSKQFGPRSCVARCWAWPGS